MFNTGGTLFLWRKSYSYGVTPKTKGHHAAPGSYAYGITANVQLISKMVVSNT